MYYGGILMLDALIPTLGRRQLTCELPTEFLSNFR